MPQVKLTESDFFRFNAPFRQWLFETKSKQIGDFSSDEAKSVFKKEFIVVWNEDKLTSKQSRFHYQVSKPGNRKILLGRGGNEDKFY